ncbi:hypothetical protein Hanom_Chr03g00230001 [Helianthus anomalus]
MQTTRRIPVISKLTDIYSGDYPSNKITDHREHTCYFQKVGTRCEKKNMKPQGPSGQLTLIHVKATNDSNPILVEFASMWIAPII